MAKTTLHVVVPFSTNDEGVLKPENPVEARSESAARNTAELLAARYAGAVAFSRSGDPELGDFDDGIVIARYGLVPDDLATYLSA